MALPKIAKGDMFSLSLTNGIGFIQCVKETQPKESEIVRIIPGVYDKESDLDISQIAMQKELFFSQLPLKYALRKKMIHFVGNFSVPKDSEAPKYYRDMHVIRTEFLGWHIVDSETLHHRLVEKLSEEEKKLSPWGMTSIPDIVEHIENNWTPLDWE